MYSDVMQYSIHLLKYHCATFSRKEVNRMYKINAKLTAAVAVMTFVATAFAPIGAASTTVNITGNGAFSANHVHVHNSSNFNVTQSNDTLVATDVNTSSNTGDNTSDFNTNGKSKIKTGNATTNVDVLVTGSSNTATDPHCGCQNSTTNVDVSGNGAYSWN